MSGVFSMRAMRAGLAALTAVACGGDCIIPPCDTTLIAVVASASTTTGTPVNATFTVTPANGASFMCNAAPNSMCIVPGSFGTYQFVIAAPGYQTSYRTVVVPGFAPTCGCALVQTVRLDVVFLPG